MRPKQILMRKLHAVFNASLRLPKTAVLPTTANMAPNIIAFVAEGGTKNMCSVNIVKPNEQIQLYARGFTFIVQSLINNISNNIRCKNEFSICSLTDLRGF